jgi:hypothetical protein
MSDLFTMETPEIRGRNKVVFYEAIQLLPDKAEISISPFTQRLRAMGATLSEESTSRYLRFLKDWKWGAVAIALGKSKYQVRKY